MSNSGERHRRGLSPKCLKCGSRGAYMSPRALGGAEVRCPKCGHLYNNQIVPWPFAVPSKSVEKSAETAPTTHNE